MTSSAAVSQVPAHLAPRTRCIRLDNLELMADIGFHDFEIGTRQCIGVTIEVWLDEAGFARDDEVSSAWDYDVLRTGVRHLVEARRYNLQETLVRAIYADIAARPGVTALRIALRKPDVYPDCEAIGVELASF